MGRLFNIFVVAITLFGAAAPCFCWVQMVSMPACHASAEMKDCCCSKDASVDREMPVPDQAVLPVDGRNSTPSSVLLPVSSVDFVTESYLSPSYRQDRGGPLRSPPDLYLIHATFLI